MKHIHSAQGIRYIPKTYLIETGAISAFHEAIIFDEYTHTGKDDFAMTEISKLATPATFSRYLKPGIFETEIDNPYTDRLDGSSEWYYFTEINPGDTIKISGAVTDVKIRTGSLGEMCIVESTFNYINQEGELSCTQISTMIYYNFSAKKQMKPNSSILSTTQKRVNTSITPLESLDLGDNIPELIKQPSTEQLVMYAGASRDFYQVHYDQRFALSIGLPKVIVHGALKSAFLAQMITNFIKQSANLTRLFVRYNSIDFEGCTMKCNGTITKIINSRSKKVINCDIWIENTKGIKTTEGSATFQLK